MNKMHNVLIKIINEVGTDSGTYLTKFILYDLITHILKY